MEKKRLNRREFLQLASLSGAALVLSACCPTEPTPSAEAPPAEAVELLMWYQAENHEPEYSRRTSELEEMFDITLTWEILDRDAMTRKFPTTLMAGVGFPDIIEQNADDIAKFMKGTDDEIPFVTLNDCVGLRFSWLTLSMRPKRGIMRTWIVLDMPITSRT